MNNLLSNKNDSPTTDSHKQEIGSMVRKRYEAADVMGGFWRWSQTSHTISVIEQAAQAWCWGTRTFYAAIES